MSIKCGLCGPEMSSETLAHGAYAQCVLCESLEVGLFGLLALLADPSMALDRWFRSHEPSLAVWQFICWPACNHDLSNDLMIRCLYCQTFTD